MMNKQNVIFDFAGKDLDNLLNQFSILSRSHSRRVAVCSSFIAEHAYEYLRFYGFRREEDLALAVHLGGTCHDIGKLLIPTLITDETDYLSHPGFGAKLLEKRKDTIFDNEIQAQIVLDMVRQHHERPDGNGFPDGLRTKDISLAASICAIADWLDHRLYSGIELFDDMDDVFNDIKSQTGIFFFEIAVICFEKAWPRLMEQYIKWKRVMFEE